MDTVEGGYGTSQMPLAGAVLCCTSISPEQRTELAAIGSQMGATIKLDLTSDVTHLIVGSINSAKYRYVAKAREDVKVLSPEWLEALRTLWMGGDDDVDVAALEREYRLPTFYGLKICLTGFDDSSQRKFIQETVVQNGAEYHGDLTKTVTHLIASAPTGKKYEHAMNWKMKIVSWEWFDESRQRGMTLDENCYDPRMPAEERGKGAWDRKLNRLPTPLGKRTRDAGPSQLVNPLRRKLRRAASSRMGTQSEALWAGITAAGLQVDQIAQDDWTEDAVVKQDTLREGIPADNVAVPQNDVHHAGDPVAQPHQSLYANRNDELFEGRVVFTHGFDVEKTQILQQHLAGNGATVIQNLAEIDKFSPDDLMRGFLVVPHDVLVDLTLLPDGAGKMCVVTNWWVERCLHGKCLVDPIANVLCRPLGKLGISGFNNLIINSTAFIGIELLHVTKVVALMGASYDEMLSAKTSVMVCNTQKPNPDKFKFATEKRIPAVYSSWLWECLRTGELQPFDQHLLNTVPTHPQKPRQKPEATLIAVPTAPLSEEDSFRLRNKKSQARKNVAKPKSGHPQPRTLNLALEADPMPISSDESSTISNPSSRIPSLGRHSDQNDSFIGGVDGSASIPLQDIHPSVNCPHRRSTSPDPLKKPHNNADSTSTSRSNSTLDAPRKPAPAPQKFKLVKEASPDTVIADDSIIPADSPLNPHEDSVIPADTSILPPEDSVLAAPCEPVPEEKDHASIMASIMAARKAHTAAVAAKNDSTSKEDDKRKRRRQLGRATSTRSNASTADDVASHASSAAEGAKRNTATLADDGVDNTAEVDYTAEDSHDARKRKIYQEYQPSQELGWDSPGAQEAREQMIRAMGGKVEEGGVMVKSIGVVKDLVSEGGAGLSRAGRKRRG